MCVHVYPSTFICNLVMQQQCTQPFLLRDLSSGPLKGPNTIVTCITNQTALQILGPWQSRCRVSCSDRKYGDDPPPQRIFHFPLKCQNKTCAPMKLHSFCQTALLLCVSSYSTVTYGVDVRKIKPNSFQQFTVKV